MADHGCFDTHNLFEVKYVCAYIWLIGSQECRGCWILTVRGITVLRIQCVMSSLGFSVYNVQSLSSKTICAEELS